MSIFSIPFLFFLIILFIAYFTVPKRMQWGVLLVASYIFYISVEWKTVSYLLVTTATTYGGALWVEKKQNQFKVKLASISNKQEKQVLKEKNKHEKRNIITLIMLVNFGILIYFKYLNFIAENIYNLLNPITSGDTFEPLKLLVPLGISFYTFQSVGYLVDVYREKINAEHNFWKFALFISYFPQILQGPISRYSQIAEQLYAEHSFEYKRFKFGLQRMLWGYFQKMVIADRTAILVNHIFSNYKEPGYDGIVIFIGILLYGIQIYCDFRGGMDIVCGVSESMGIDLPLNFRQPYLSRSVTEYWQRWHVTLGAWLKDYVFYPLALSKSFHKMGKFLRKHCGNYIGKILPTCIASFVTFLIMGIWHEASWEYVFYGFYHATLVSFAALLAPIYSKTRKKLHIDSDNAFFQAFQLIRTIFIISIGRYFSHAESFGQAIDLLAKTFSSVNLSALYNGLFVKMGLDGANVTLLAFCVLFLILIDVLHEQNISLREWISKRNIVIRYTIYMIGIFSILVFGIYGEGYDAATFIYQGF